MLYLALPQKLTPKLYVQAARHTKKFHSSSTYIRYSLMPICLFQTCNGCFLGILQQSQSLHLASLQLVYLSRSVAISRPHCLCDRIHTSIHSTPSSQCGLLNYLPTYYSYKESYFKGFGCMHLDPYWMDIDFPITFDDCSNKMSAVC